ncbi:M48 family metallopeptidase [Sphingomonas sp. CBMAI 2297]|uniref:M48 family metallopeptidase n=1 Tax=Sphingomonas sp. CBMAI 2297 TaxID=2991720 RepID=UPI0024556DE7|nr:M48 family metallopeptidase [Sphingomonas sp. CBMAI 2297]MDH4743004.1 M48 family metallopeptidase [Sphingomonas sp. CBMAI 2297]
MSSSFHQFRPAIPGLPRDVLAGILALLAFPISSARADDTALFEAVRAADVRVAGIGWKLATANAALCDRIEAGTGLQLHTLDQFDGAARESARNHFHFATPVAVEGVIAGGPGDRAGLRADDSLVRVGTVDIAALPGKPGSTAKLVAAQLAIAALPVDAPIAVQAIREGAPLQVTIQPVRACKSRFELELGGGFGASADGTMVQIGSGFLYDYPDDQLAAVIAHEFSHNILRHRDRLEARGVDYGLLSGFGANVKYFRQTEVQADILSVYLLANANYPVRASIAFWRHFGPSKAGGILRSRSHPAWRDRVATLEATSAKVETLSARPIMPPFLADREKPLDGDWQSILVRSR